ncbi:MAG: hypothetical protein KHY12_04930 [Firmicutes bacterium]|nr:hypothetical protein [Bacillota bacterium]
MSDKNFSCEDENEKLMSQIEDLECSLTAKTEEMYKLTQKAEKLDAQNAELRGKIKFLEGQIEAYQYCMNCRR